MSLRHLIQSLRIVAVIEGLSWIVLIGALICEVVTGHHEQVSWSGRVHGGLFCLFSLALFLCWRKGQWPFKFTLLIGLSSLIPFGFLIADPFLRKKLASVA